METYPILLGTAGHIDHGKTSLVRALTGIDTDRLEVEKERGITTELGFAHLDLGARRFGVVDVPGHERFIKSMVSGAAGLDLVCLVIAADEGIMPQTREHLDICELLGVRRGLVALSKADLVDDDWLALVTEDVRAGLAKSFLADAPIVPVSSQTGAGLDELRATLVAQTETLGARSAEGSFRLPIDRVFTIKGFGTVVTGSVLSGSVAVGDDVVVLPLAPAAKVRGLEVHGDAAPRARAGMRCAINLAGLALSDVTRGDMLAHPGGLAPSHILDARFRYLPSSRSPLGRRTRVLLHHGTSQTLANLVLVDRDELLPGAEALVQLRIDAATPLAALPGDHFICRGFVVQAHYGTTLGGGEIVRVQAPKVRRTAAEARAALEAIAASEADDRVALEVRAASAAGSSLADLRQRLGLGNHALGSALGRLVQSGELLRAGKGEAAIYAHAEVVARLEKRATDAAAAHAAAHPEKRGLPTAELAARLPPALPARLFGEILDGLVRRRALEIDRDVVRKPGSDAAAPSRGASELEHRVADAFRDWGNTPERPNKVAAALGTEPRATNAAIEKLVTAGTLVKTRADLYLHKDAIDALRASLLAHLETHGEITPAEWKDITGASRKFSIPLAEHFDKEKLTLRVGDIRKRRG